MSIGFHEIEDSVVIVRAAKGVFKQAKAYFRKDKIYVAAAGGYVVLRADGRTGHPNLAWEDIELPFGHTFDKQGKMVAE